VKIDNRRVLFIAEAGDSSCAYYRAQLPAKGLRQLGWTVDVASSLVELPDGCITGFDQRLGLLPVPQFMICRRINEPVPGTISDSGSYASIKNMVRKARKRGQIVFIDLDDDSWNLPEHNPAYGNMTKYEMDLWAEDMYECNGVIVSTAALATSVLIHTDINAVVCRNGIDKNLYKYTANATDRPLRLGWCGTLDYRGRDLQTIVESLRELLAGRFGEVEFWHVGDVSTLSKPLDIYDVLGPDFPVQIRSVPWVPISRLALSLASVDVAVVPMEETRFNSARSNVTGLALCAAGVPFAYPQWHEEYDILWRQGAGYPMMDNVVPNVLVDKEYESVRHDMRSAGLAVAANHNPANTAMQYTKVFEQWL